MHIEQEVLQFEKSKTNLKKVLQTGHLQLGPFHDLIIFLKSPNDTTDLQLFGSRFHIFAP